MTATGISFPFINSLIYEHKEKDQTSVYNTFINLYFQTEITFNLTQIKNLLETSVLFASEVSPLLPRNVANGFCSLE